MLHKEKRGSLNVEKKKDKERKSSRQLLEDMVNQAVESVQDGSITIVIQDHEPIQINISHKYL